MIYQKESLPNYIDCQLTDDLIFGDFMTGREESIATTELAFTPTTLARFQNTLSELNNDLALSASSGQRSCDQLVTSANQSDYSDDDDDDDEDTCSQDSNSNMTNSRKRKAQPEYITMTAVGTLPGTTDQRPPRKLPGPRPKRTLEEMSPIEAERRKRRRERNKNAAAKCRQRRLEQTNELLNETEELEQEALRMEREIASLRRQKNQLEFVLDSHKSSCKALQLLAAPQVNLIHSVKPEVKRVSVTQPSTTGQVGRPNTLPISHPLTTCPSSINSLTTTDSFSMFSFDPITSMSGLTPMLSSAADLNSPSAFIMLSPSTLLA